MLRILIFQLMLILFCGSQKANLFAQAVTTLPTADSLSLAFLTQVQRYQDHTGKLGIETIAWAQQQGLFKAYDEATQTDTTKVKVTWFAITIPATQILDQPWYLTSKKMPGVQFSCYLQQTDKNYRLQANEQQIPTKDFYFQPAQWVQLLPPNTTTCQLLLRIQSDTKTPIAFQLKTAKSLQQATNQSYLKIGLGYGALVALFLYHCLLFVVRKKRLYLFYSLLVGSIGLWCCAQMTDRFALLNWPPTLLPYLVLLTSYAVALSYFAYATILLQLRTQQNKLFKGILILLATSFLFFLGNISLFHAAMPVILFSGIFSLVLIATCSIHRQKKLPASSFFWIPAIGWLSIVLCATSLFTSVKFTYWSALLTPSFLLNGSFLSALLLSIARQPATAQLSKKTAQPEAVFSSKTVVSEIAPASILAGSVAETEVEVEIKY